ncbi:hypothetical protein ACFLVN_03385 [Chloroflexota bacterium]
MSSFMVRETTSVCDTIKSPSFLRSTMSLLTMSGVPERLKVRVRNTLCHFSPGDLYELMIDPGTL